MENVASLPWQLRSVEVAVLGNHDFSAAVVAIVKKDMEWIAVFESKGRDWRRQFIEAGYSKEGWSAWWGDRPLTDIIYEREIKNAYRIKVEKLAHKFRVQFFSWRLKLHEVTSRLICSEREIVLGGTCRVEDEGKR